MIDIVYDVTEALVLPITVEQAKDHLRVPHDRDDDYIETLIIAAREACEAYLGRAIVEQTIVARMSAWPASQIISLPLARLKTLVKLEYINEAGTTVQIDSGNLFLDKYSVPSKIKLTSTETWPDLHEEEFYPVIIEYEAGWDIEEVPMMIIQGIKEHVADMYVNRTPVVLAKDGRIAVKMPAPLHRLYGPYRVRL